MPQSQITDAIDRMHWQPDFFDDSNMSSIPDATPRQLIESDRNFQRLLQELLPIVQENAEHKSLTLGHNVGYGGKSAEEGERILAEIHDAQRFDWDKHEIRMSGKSLYLYDASEKDHFGGDNDLVVEITGQFVDNETWINIYRRFKEFSENGFDGIIRAPNTTPDGRTTLGTNMILIGFCWDLLLKKCNITGVEHSGEILIKDQSNIKISRESV